MHINIVFKILVALALVVHWIFTLKKALVKPDYELSPVKPHYSDEVLLGVFTLAYGFIILLLFFPL